MKEYFQPLFKQLSDRGTSSSISGLQIANKPLRHHISTMLSQEMGAAGGLLGDPVFEATFPWKNADLTLNDLSGQLLEPTLVEALDQPPKEYKAEYRFPKNLRPYTHQLAAWRVLLDSKQDKKQSVVVTSGTGSGKTECFLIPILNDLAGEYRQSQKTLEGVRALFLYPLNALIESQKERLNAWTHSFGSGIRYCLYNGLTPERPPKKAVNQCPNAVESRRQLRDSPPPILVTNATMLEYMLVRTNDRPIIDRSQGQLRWIVLDEAHTYLGSQAAEISLLLRRVMLAFNVFASDVRFIATSATIGSDESAKQR
ncbi:MAG: DEAD/DEAH box helicase, partial [Methylococcales bacterium]|nr:DEAD/DEAH box helicase [Methylococcales bacterium]